MTEIAQSLIEKSVVAGLLALLIWWMTNRQERLLGTMVKSINITNLLLVGLQKELLAHDLTVSGINPSSGGDHMERDSKALAKYEEIRKVFAAIEEQLKQMNTGN